MEKMQEKEKFQEGFLFIGLQNNLLPWRKKQMNSSECKSFNKSNK